MPSVTLIGNTLNRACPFALLLACCLSSAQHAADSTCGSVLRKRIQADLTLPFQAFDQTSAAGWRQLSEQGCFAEAAELIRRYGEANGYAHPVLRWHQAQMEAMADQTESAIVSALATLRGASEEEKSSFRWNPYVLGTVAFLRRDRQGLEVQHAELARAAAADPMNAINAGALSRLKACFNKPYREAYSC